jgi:tRNA(Arg) A34 adenosine deaminase TadA
VLRLPEWIGEAVPNPDGVFASAAERMQLAIELSRRNVECGTGGPFGAAVFERDSGRLLAVGVNRVIPTNCSIAHAETMAIANAQQTLGCFDLGTECLPAYELVSSTEPCAMCFGAVHWSGVRRLVCGARDEDARSVGFDEGAKPRGWVRALERRGVAVVRDVLRAEAKAVLVQYVEAGGILYNARRGRTPNGAHRA